MLYKVLDVEYIVRAGVFESSKLVLVQEMMTFYVQTDTGTGRVSLVSDTVIGISIYKHVSITANGQFFCVILTKCGLPGYTI